MADIVHTAAEAINALGGTYAVAILFGEDPRVVSNWRVRGLPPDTIHKLGPLLTRHGYEFDAEKLFRQRAAAADIDAVRAQASRARTSYKRKKKHNTKRR